MNETPSFWKSAHIKNIPYEIFINLTSDQKMTQQILSAGQHIYLSNKLLTIRAENGFFAIHICTLTSSCPSCSPHGCWKIEEKRNEFISQNARTKILFHLSFYKCCFYNKKHQKTWTILRERQSPAVQIFCCVHCNQIAESRIIRWKTCKKVA